MTGDRDESGNYSPLPAVAPTSAPSSLATVISIAIVAYAACDMIHEVLGHGLACAMTPGVKALSLSTVALQTSSESRFVAAAGSVMNVLAGLFLLDLFRLRKRFDSMGYFLWLLATLNLFNGTGYLLFSGLLDVGDWAVVIAGREPHWAWRVALAIGGVVTYAAAISISAGSMASRVRGGQVDRRDIARLAIPAYVAGGILLVAGAALNPISPSLILMSGLSSGFGAMFGLALIPRFVERRTAAGATGAPGLRVSRAWVVCALLVAAIFVGVVGRGIPLP
ncbi:MAG TPA: hypothetical protein VK527_04985 [Candidatus Limnocylindrales bacterium]|nr:hypothetical protein [Candidatus Limnocylindrales bacterium]